VSLASLRKDNEMLMRQTDSALDSACNDWFFRQIRSLHESMYLYYKPHNNAFYIGPDRLNEDWKLVTAEAVSIGKSQRQVFYWALNLIKSLPIYPIERQS
jgi:hypothetical protein